jgi:hypothetical protein
MGESSAIRKVTPCPLTASKAQRVSEYQTLLDPEFGNIVTGVFSHSSAILDWNKIRRRAATGSPRSSLSHVSGNGNSLRVECAKAAAKVVTKAASTCETPEPTRTPPSSPNSPKIGFLKGHPRQTANGKMNSRQNHDCARWNTKKNTITLNAPNA